MNTIRYFITTTFAFILLSSVSTTYAQTCHYEVYGLNRPVKSVRVITYEAFDKFGEIIKGEIQWEGNYVAEFNSVGNLTTQRLYDNEGDLYEMRKYIYDGTNLIEDNVYDREGNLICIWRYEYEGDYLIKESFINTQLASDNTTEFRRNGKQILEIIKYFNGELLSKQIVIRHDDSGLEWIEYNSEDRPIRNGYEKFDAEGRRVEVAENDNIVSIEWNDNNLPSYLKGARLYNKTIIAYSFDDSDVFSIEYEYDNNGNWIRQVIYDITTGIKLPLTVSERVITY